MITRKYISSTNLITYLLSSFFFLHILTIERYSNNFIEFDTHIFIIFTSIIGLFQVLKNVPHRLNLSFSSGDWIALLIVLYITCQEIFNSISDGRAVVICWLSLLYYFTLRPLVVNREFFFLKSFTIANVMVALIQVSEFKLFDSLLFPNGEAEINSGLNSIYSAIISPFILTIILNARKRGIPLWVILLNCITLVFILVQLFLGSSRTSWIAFGVSASFVLYQSFKLKIFFFFKVISKLKNLLIIIGIGVSLMVSTYLYSIRPASINGRFLIYRVTSDIIQDNIIFGIGFKRFGSIYNWYQSNYFQQNPDSLRYKLVADNTYYAFNEFLQLFTELGAIGIGLCFVFVYVQIKVSTSKELMDKGAISSLIAVLICCFSSYPLHLVSIGVYCVFCLGIIRLPQHTITIELTGNIRYLCRIIGTTIFLLLIVNELRAFRAFVDWEKAVYYALNDDFDNAENYYNLSYNQLKDNGQFLYNYGAELVVSGRPKMGNHYLNEAATLYPNSELLVYLGDSYEQLANYRNAEIAYLESINMVPSRFTAKYKLLKLYIQNCDTTAATLWASDIVRSQVKIPSSKVSEIQDFARRFLSRTANSNMPQ